MPHRNSRCTSTRPRPRRSRLSSRPRRPSPSRPLPPSWSRLRSSRPPPSAGIADHHLHAARLLGLAEETAARVTSEADIEAENTRSSARAESEKLLSDARNESERMLTEAKNSSESTIADANAKAESTVRDSQIKAEALDREAQRKYSEVMTQLTTQRTSLENKIDGLRTYEREYRSRLKNWINDQLHQLDASDGDGTADGPVAVGQGPGQPGAGENNGSPRTAEVNCPRRRHRVARRMIRLCAGCAPVSLRHPLNTDHLAAAD